MRHKANIHVTAGMKRRAWLFLIYGNLANSRQKIHGYLPVKMESEHITPEPIEKATNYHELSKKI